MAVGMGGLNPRPLNAPPAGGPGIGVQPGPNNGVFFGRLAILFGPSGAVTGIFEYASGTTPGLGNPPIAYMVPNGVTHDPFGNALPISGGVVSVSSTGAWSQLFNGNLVFQDSSAANNWVVQATTISGHKYLQVFANPGGALVVDQVTGYLIAQDPVSLGVETWHAPTTTGFGTIAGAQPVEYRVNAVGNVEITGVMAASGAYTASTTIWTMPVGYRPTTNTASVSVDIDTGGTFSSAIAQITSAGLVSIPINVAGAAEVFFSGGSYRLPL